MSKIFAIVSKELKAYFKSPVAYIVLIVTVTIFNILFFLIIDENREATLKDIFTVMEFMFVFLVPILTMKTFAEEKANGTMEFLVTTPTSNTAIVLGKYLGSLGFLTFMIAFTLIYYVILEVFAAPDRTAILTGYFGIWLEGAFFVAIGILASSWTRSQIVSAITTYIILFLLYFSTSFVKYLHGISEGALRYASTITHAENFRVGLITLPDLIYYLSGIIFCLLLTRLSVENRLWR